jgi:hypothetical protein
VVPVPPEYLPEALPPAVFLSKPAEKHAPKDVMPQFVSIRAGQGPSDRQISDVFSKPSAFPRPEPLVDSSVTSRPPAMPPPENREKLLQHGAPSFNASQARGVQSPVIEVRTVLTPAIEFPPPTILAQLASGRYPIHAQESSRSAKRDLSQEMAVPQAPPPSRSTSYNSIVNKPAASVSPPVTLDPPTSKFPQPPVDISVDPPSRMASSENRSKRDEVNLITPHASSPLAVPAAANALENLSVTPMIPPSRNASSNNQPKHDVVRTDTPVISSSLTVTAVANPPPQNRSLLTVEAVANPHFPNQSVTSANPPSRITSYDTRSKYDSARIDTPVPSSSMTVTAAASHPPQGVSITPDKPLPGIVSSDNRSNHNGVRIETPASLSSMNVTAASNQPLEIIAPDKPPSPIVLPVNMSMNDGARSETPVISLSTTGREAANRPIQNPSVMLDKLPSRAALFDNQHKHDNVRIGTPVPLPSVSVVEVDHSHPNPLSSIQASLQPPHYTAKSEAPEVTRSSSVPPPKLTSTPSSRVTVANNTSSGAPPPTSGAKQAQLKENQPPQQSAFAEANPSPDGPAPASKTNSPILHRKDDQLASSSTYVQDAITAITPTTPVVAPPGSKPNASPPMVNRAEPKKLSPQIERRQMHPSHVELSITAQVTVDTVHSQRSRESPNVVRVPDPVGTSHDNVSLSMKPASCNDVAKGTHSIAPPHFVPALPTVRELPLPSFSDPAGALQKNVTSISQPVAPDTTPPKPSPVVPHNFLAPPPPQVVPQMSISLLKDGRRPEIPLSDLINTAQTSVASPVRIVVPEDVSQQSLLPRYLVPELHIGSRIVDDRLEVGSRHGSDPVTCQADITPSIRRDVATRPQSTTRPRHFGPQPEVMPKICHESPKIEPRSESSVPKIISSSPVFGSNSHEIMPKSNPPVVPRELVPSSPAMPQFVKNPPNVEQRSKVPVVNPVSVSQTIEVSLAPQEPSEMVHRSRHAAVPEHFIPEPQVMPRIVVESPKLPQPDLADASINGGLPLQPTQVVNLPNSRPVVVPQHAVPMSQAQRSELSRLDPASELQSRSVVLPVQTIPSESVSRSHISATPQHFVSEPLPVPKFVDHPLSNAQPTELHVPDLVRDSRTNAASSMQPNLSEAVPRSERPVNHRNLAPVQQPPPEKAKPSELHFSEPTGSSQLADALRSQPHRSDAVRNESPVVRPRTVLPAPRANLEALLKAERRSESPLLDSSQTNVGAQPVSSVVHKSHPADVSHHLIPVLRITPQMADDTPQLPQVFLPAPAGGPEPKKDFPEQVAPTICETAQVIHTSLQVRVPSEVRSSLKHGHSKPLETSSSTLRNVPKVESTETPVVISQAIRETPIGQSVAPKVVPRDSLSNQRPHEVCFSYCDKFSALT